MDITKTLSAELGVREQYVANIISLLDEGCTVPFIARYRKEMHGTTDDQTIRLLEERLAYLRNLEQKKADVTASITEQGHMTPELLSAIDAAETLAALEDIYRPYRPKRRTRATIAKERGLQGLADALLRQDLTDAALDALAASFVNADKEVPDLAAAYAGACDIIAEAVSDSPAVRKDLKADIAKTGRVGSAAKTEEDTVYSMYYDYSEPFSKIPAHRILAINRGEKENVLKVSLDADRETELDLIRRRYVRGRSEASRLVDAACVDGYDRLLFPSLERESRGELTEMAEKQAIKMFGQNLKPLLMTPPVKGKVVLAVDPAYRTGCKLAVVDANGKVLDTGVIYPTPPQNKKEESAAKVRALISRWGVNCISIGNGTASKEAELFIAETIRPYGGAVTYAIVNEAGASVYSASKLGAAEFPQFDVSIRSAVSIARRLQDPLSELVKIDPKSIGVGQYQHDLPQNELSASLKNVVEDCVNAVGVDLNTASPSILQYVSGVSSSVSQNIVAYRDEHGAFATRMDLKKVKGLGPKAFEQCAGFLRIPGGREIFDNTGVHPESYDAAERLLRLVGVNKKDVGAGLPDLPKQVAALGREKVAAAVGVGVPTLDDIVRELTKPGRDIRDSLPKPILRADVLSMEDLVPGMTLKGTVRNVIDFGAFVDIGVHQDGLVHVSEMSERYIKHPGEVVKVGDVVSVRVMSVDLKKKRISLTMRKI